MNTKIKYLVLALCFSLPMLSQSIDRQVLASAGKEVSTSAGSLEFTLGEPITQTMQGFTNGFHQPVFTITNMNSTPDALGISVFPNPSNQFVIVKFNQTQQHSLIELCDLSGQVLQSYDTDGYEQTINLSNMANGAYFLKINKTQVYKIIKLH